MYYVQRIEVQLFSLSSLSLCFMRGQGSAEEESGEDQEEVLGLVQRGHL